MQGLGVHVEDFDLRCMTRWKSVVVCKAVSIIRLGSGKCHPGCYAENVLEADQSLRRPAGSQPLQKPLQERVVWVRGEAVDLVSNGCD